ncbi:RNA 3'-terminal phosphate cyclase [Rhizodiscina lignyota]|uniref:RNA 3'-terminal phosphate cyclase n=1 Tax=Rhizodiscina lignyota TaxID=1504668 RepID=A0A9P4IN17_9PEZI|nr:RNA 3'-terminal phosphate cyclase [Rhizodiscina lignyota]
MAPSQGKKQRPIHLPGTHLEGGGQLLRLATSLSALTQQPIQINNIRGNRSGGGGMKAQHLTAVRWLASACGARTSGMGLKSKSLVFTPGGEAEEGGDALDDVESTIDIGSPGAVSLVFQAILPFVLFSSSQAEPTPVHITIKGGTNVSNSPSVDYLRLVLFPTLTLIGFSPISVHVRSRGWSLGRTEVGAATFSITPLAKGKTLSAFQLKDRGKIVSLEAVVLAPRTAEKELLKELERTVGDEFPGIPLQIEYEDSLHPKRLYLLLVATCENGYKLGRDWLYGAEGDFKIKKKAGSSVSPAIAAEQLVKHVVRDISAEIAHGGCVDEHMRDQMAVFQALAEGKSVVDGGRDEDGGRVKASLHARTVQWVAGEVVGVDFDKEGSCNGVGFVVGEHFDSKRRRGPPPAAEAQLAEQLEELHV